MTIGHCKHGEFELEKGCDECVTEKRAGSIRPEQDEAKEIGHSYSAQEIELSDRSEYRGLPPISLTNEGLNAEGFTLANPDAWRTGEEEQRPEQEELLEAGEKLQVGDTMVPGEGGKYYKLKPEPIAETALVLRTGEDVEVRGYFEESQRLLEFAVARLIGTLEDNKAANDDLIIISKLKRRMEDKRKEYLEPLKAQSDAIRATYNELMGPVLEADQITRGKMLAYTTEQDRIREEQEKINRKRMEAAEAEMKLKGELTESVNLVEVIPEIKRVSTDLGTSGQTAHWKYEVVDFAVLPDAYKVADSSQLSAIARKHHDQKQIPGVRFYNEPGLTVRAR